MLEKGKVRASIFGANCKKEKPTLQRRRRRTFVGKKRDRIPPECVPAMKVAPPPPPRVLQAAEGSESARVGLLRRGIHQKQCWVRAPRGVWRASVNGGSRVSRGQKVPGFYYRPRLVQQRTSEVLDPSLAVINATGANIHLVSAFVFPPASYFPEL